MFYACVLHVRSRPSPPFQAFATLVLGGALVLTTLAQGAAPAAKDPILKARAAFAQRDRATLVALRKSTAAAAHPLAMWVDYWELSLRLPQAKQADLEQFYARWPGTAVEDRLRKDWIVARGKLGDLQALSVELPRVRSFDVREADPEPGSEPAGAWANDHDSEPGSDRGSDPRDEPGSDPGSDPGSEPGSEPGSDPGSEPGSEPGNDPGSEPGSEAGSEPGGGRARVPGSDGGNARNSARDSARDREVKCYSLLLRYYAGQDVVGAARERWFAQREADHGCALLAATLYRAGELTRDDVWERARLAAEQGRRFVAQHAIGLLGSLSPNAVQEAFLQPSRFLSRRIAKPTPDEAELTALAAIRLGLRNAPAAAAVLSNARTTPMPPRSAGAAWAVLAKSAASNQRPQAFEWYQRAAAAAAPAAIEATPDTLAWQVRSALRAQDKPQRWQMIIDAVQAMGAEQLADPTWTYWKARALLELAPPAAQGEAQRRAALKLLESISTQLHYYGALAARELGLEPQLPKPAPPLSDAERAAAQQRPGLQRGLALFELRLREEGNAEWNHALGGLNDRGLRAAAQVACDAQVWNVCMSTSERTRSEIDMAQRFPMPFHAQVEAAAREADIDIARLYAVIRQESHFSVGARSTVGASGLMQLMPQTARWVAGRYRIPFRRDSIHDPAMNVRLGARYLKLVLNDFDGSHAHAAAAYNAGPSRPRRWNKAGIDDAAAWTETIPINETRDYVKNVLANGASYSALLAAVAAARARVEQEVEPAPTPQVLLQMQELSIP